MRYFFPEGCRGFDSEISAEKNPITPLIMKTTTTGSSSTPSKTNPIRFPEPPKPTPAPPKIPSSPNTPQFKQIPLKPSVPFVPNTSQPNPFPTQGPKISPPQKYLPPPQKYLPPAVKSPIQQQPINGRYITKAPAKSLPPSVLKPVAPKPVPPQFSKSSPPLQNKISTNGEKSNCEIGTCESQTITIKMSVPDSVCVDEESLPKIVIPIKLKNGRSDSCPSYAKLIVPADSVNVNSLKSNPTELAKMVLKSLF